MCTLLGSFFVILAAQATFQDVYQNHPNYDAIDHVLNENIVQGYSDGTYRPDITINRAEFTKILMGDIQAAQRVSCMSNLQRRIVFSDVPRDTWFAPYVCIAKENAIIQGYPDGSFRPEREINVAEAAKIIAKKYNLAKEDPNAGAWYQPFVQGLAAKDAIPLSIQRFDEFVTRGEMAEMIYRLQTRVKKPSQTYESIAQTSAPAGSTIPLSQVQTPVQQTPTQQEEQESTQQNEQAEDVCQNVRCDDYCDGNMRYSNGRCVDGQCVYTSVRCNAGCERGACLESNPCAGVNCSDTCENNSRKHNGQCVNGQCQYAIQNCEHGCANGACTEAHDPCIGVTCNDYCSGNVLSGDGVCVNGQCQYSTTNCATDYCIDANYLRQNGRCVNNQCEYLELGCIDGCINGECNSSNDLCDGVVCADYCSGEGLHSNGSCVGGQCQYAFIMACQYGCENGDCIAPPDPCEGVTCNDYCAGGTAYSGGQCVNGNCQYGSENCEWGCDDTACLEYYCAWVWPQRVINKRTKEVIWECVIGDWPYCNQNKPECCPDSSKTNCADCTIGHCTGADCIGVSCNDYCDGTTRKYNGGCLAGQCQYSTEQCQFGCNNDQCTTVGVVFVASPFWKGGEIGGVAGADAKCQARANVANLSGTWKAIISDSNTNAKDRLPNVVFRNLDGKVIANNKADLFDGNIANFVNKTELGDGINKEAWTGTNADGTHSGNNCNNWSDSTTQVQGTKGRSSGFKDHNWIEWGQSNCNLGGGLYCVAVSN